MRRYFFYPLLLIFLFCAANFVYSSEQQAEKEVVVTGDALIIDDDVAGANQRAKREALREAVEQGLGILIKNETLVENYQLIEESIFMKSDGYVKEYEIISEKQAGKRFLVTIKAVVSLASIKNDLIAINILQEEMGYPRIMIIVGSEKGAATDSAKAARIALEKYFSEKHYDLVDPGASKRLHKNTKLLLKVTKDTVIAAKTGLDHHAEIIITAIVSSKSQEKVSPFESATSNIRLRAIDPQTARILVSYEKSVPGAGATPENALKNSGRQAAELAAEYASEEILKWWKEFKSSGTHYKIILKNIKDYNSALLFQDKVRNIHGVSRISERSFGGGFLELDISYTGEKPNFQRTVLKKITSVKGFSNLNIVSSTGSRIVFEK